MTKAKYARPRRCKQDVGINECERQGTALFSSFLTSRQLERSDFKSNWTLSRCFARSGLVKGLISTVSPL